MRIRKHAKISPLLYASSSLKPGTALQSHVICQLNQSPWDVMKFSPPPTPPRPPPTPSPPQVGGGAVSAGNGSSGNCIPVSDRVCAFVCSVHNFFPFSFADQWRIDQHCGYSDDIPAASAADNTEEPPSLSSSVEENEAEIILCCKTDGKSWQCRKEASKGSSLCNHHLSQVKSYYYHNSSSRQAAKKSEKLRVEAGRPARTKRAPATSTSSPYEFYYYSGFGPRWGKKRGETNCKNSSSVKRNIEHEDEIEHATGRYDEHEDEEDEEEESRDIVGKKRVRKPIKARSLKSLM
ncbi:hypothetical protein OROGR_025060 [Orobanche gracilis]